ncbi:SLBB domain-containing protein [Arsenicibacter rosenii]|uniref:Sugar transporter n=1 Tax=Arsenicibacter rosenii TaxID=1750698 RepID=A0A1S2VCU2_9BACT|nr:SLBB domain-containing protein [Arsenicibacter rosenii]OIN56512.1 sugar transporter [Arsenicibacter rosenii]
MTTHDKLSVYTYYIRLYSKKAAIVTWILLAGTAVLAQQKSVSRVDQLSDDQVLEFYRRAQASGLTEMQIEQAAMSQGYTLDDITKMRRRMTQLRTQGSRTTGQSVPDTGIVRTLPGGLSRRVLSDSLSLFSLDTVKKPVVFGASLFQNANLSFEPNLRMATPKGYIVGPDDEILVDIYGASVANMRLKVSPEGTVKMEGLAPVVVNGLTIEQAEQRIIGRLRQAYQGLGSNGTYATVTLGNIRSIRVTIVGEVVRPGTYTISSLGSAFNALYLAGGPNPETGSFRKINILRGNKVVRTIDLYDFLLRADQKDNIRLQDQDVIRVGDYETRVEFIGEVRRPAIYELLPGENLKTALSFAGGFTDEAYTASFTVRRNTSRERKILTVTEEQLAGFVPQRGDKYTVGKILNRYENLVQITGAVMRPGEYALEPGLTTVRELIKRAEGLRNDAFMNRAQIFRERTDMDIENISFSVSKLLKGEVADIPLQRQDSVVIQSIRDLRETYYVIIEGAVNKPDSFLYVRNLSAADLIAMAGGFKEGAAPSRIEIARRIGADTLSTKGARPTVEIFSFALDPALGISSSNTNGATPAEFTLQPFDILYVRSAPYYENQQRVYIGGEVMHSGNYAIVGRSERINDLIRRAGGLKPEAYLQGAQFKRRGDLVATDLRKILDDIGVEQNLLLESGDSLFIPRKSEIVRVQGAVLNPSSVSFERGFSFRDYVAQAGGYTENARKNKSYVIYPSGRKQVGQRSKVEPGSIINVPFKPLQENRMSPAERVGILSLVGTLAATTATILINILSKSN